MKCKTYNIEYSRAFTSCDRNIYWKNIVSKTGYEVEILLESDNYEFIKQKEIEFIALYGRKDLGLGTLVNWTNGCDGQNGYKWTEEQKLKIKGNKNGSGKRSKEHSEYMSLIRKGRKAWNKGIKNPLMSILKSKITLQFDLNNKLIAEFSSATEASKITKVYMKSIGKCVNNQRKTAGGFIWKYKSTDTV